MSTNEPLHNSLSWIDEIDHSTLYHCDKEVGAIKLCQSGRWYSVLDYKRYPEDGLHGADYPTREDGKAYLERWANNRLSLVTCRS